MKIIRESTLSLVLSGSEAEILSVTIDNIELLTREKGPDVVSETAWRELRENVLNLRRQIGGPLNCMSSPDDERIFQDGAITTAAKIGGGDVS